MATTKKYRLAAKGAKPINFKFGRVNVIVGTEATEIEETYAQLIRLHYPGWIVRVNEARKKKGTAGAE